MRERLRARLPDLDGRKLFFMATHAHSTPPFDENQYAAVPGKGMLRPSEYLDFLLPKLPEVVETAWTARRPGGFTWGLGHAVVGQNRRVVYPDGRAVMGGWTKNPDFDRVEGPDDHGVELLFCWSPEHRLTGVLINVACPSQVDSQALFISSDFWDGVRRELRRHPDFAEAAILPQLGAAGDQWPTRHYVREKAEVIMQQRRGLTRTQEKGRRIANAVLDVYPYVKDGIVFDPIFRHRVEPVRLPYRIIPAQEAADMRQQLDRFKTDVDNPLRPVRSRYFGVLLDRFAAQQQGVPQTGIEVHAIRLGDIAIVTNPFELFWDYGLQIKSRSPAVLTLTSQLSAEVAHAEAYLATQRAVAAGGYSAEALWYNHVGPEGGRMLVDRTVELLQELWKSEPVGGTR